MAIKSSNTHGNPYHDESTGEFTSGNSSSQKVMDKMGIGEYNNNTNNFSLQGIIPETNLDGSKRTILSRGGYNRTEMVKKWNQIYEMETLMDLDTPKINPTIEDESEQRLQLRENLKDNELKKQESTPKRYERQVTIIFGLPASGKSGLTQKYMNDYGAYEVDSDLFTREIPEFKKDHSQIGSVHAEASVISNSFMNDIMSKGGNMVIGKVGGDANINGLTRLFDALGKQGYKINLVLNDIPVEESLKRNLQRHKNGEPRLVPAKVPIIADTFIHKNFENLMNNEAVMSGSVYSNDVPYGSPAKLLKQWNKSIK